MPGNVTAFCRQRKLLPLPTPQQITEIVKKLKANTMECAFVFDLKTTTGKKTETKTGKFYFQRNDQVTNLRFDFANQSFLSLKEAKGEVFCSGKVTKMRWDDPIQEGHLLSFSDVLMPFLESGGEYCCQNRVQGRNTHIIRFKEDQGRVVNIAYDPVFEVVLQVEHFDEKGQCVRTFKLLEFKKAQGTWFMKTIEIKSHDITSQLIIKKIALKQAIPAAIFNKNTLEQPNEDRLTYIDF
jgi:hypothetical protein